MSIPDHDSDLFIADLHCDTALALRRGFDLAARHRHYHIDIPRLRQGGVSLQLFAAFISSKLPEEIRWPRLIEYLDSLEQAIAVNSNTISLCRNSSEITAACQSGRIAAMMTLENGAAIGDSLERLDELGERGVRLITLVHSQSHHWCGSSTDSTDRNQGLSDFGREVVRTMNRRSMIVDLSHASDQAAGDAIAVSTAPVVASHSNARSICDHPRNLPDHLLKAISETGGVIGVCFCPAFLNTEFGKAEMAFLNRQPGLLDEIDALFCSVEDENAVQTKWQEIESRLTGMPEVLNPYWPTIETVVDHIDYIAELVGDQHVALGSDFDGIGSTPRGLEDISRLPLLLSAMKARGWPQKTIAGIAGGNALRLIESVCG